MLYVEHIINIVYISIIFSFSRLSFNVLKVPASSLIYEEWTITELRLILKLNYNYLTANYLNQAAETCKF